MSKLTEIANKALYEAGWPALDADEAEAMAMGIVWNMREHDMKELLDEIGGLNIRDAVLEYCLDEWVEKIADALVDPDID